MSDTRTSPGENLLFQRLVRISAGYGLAVGSTGLAALARWMIPWALSPAPYLGFYPAVVVSAALGGVGPGLLATFSSLLLVNFVFGHFNLHDHGSVARQLIWVAASLGVSLLAGMQRAARIREQLQADKLRLFNDELELRVQERTAEIREANDRLRTANEKLAELDHAKTAFFNNVSHEFRTPLTLMLGPLEDALQRHGARPSPEREELALIHRNALRLLRLVNTLLDFSRLEANRIHPAYQQTDLALLTQELASTFRSAVERGGLTLSVDTSAFNETVYVDPEMWEKIVLNLLSNALKFTHQGRITLRLAVVDQMAELTVSDTGIGIEPDEIPYLFDRFHRVAGAQGRSMEGTGIGLAMVRELVKLHGGSVSVESGYGKGSTFTVRLPLGTDHIPAGQIGAGAAKFHHALQEEPLGELVTDPDRAPLPPESEAELGGNNEKESRPRILLVDDNPDMLAYLSRLLAGSYQVQGVADGTSALDAALSDPPDLVLSDVMMPGLDGFALLRELRRDPRTTAVPVILLSARAGEDELVEGLEARADDYLSKPFSARELLARVKAHLEMARVRREAQALRRFAEERHESVRQAEELRKKNEDLARLNRAMVGREMRMVELKEEVNELCALSGRPLKYPLDTERKLP